MQRSAFSNGGTPIPTIGLYHNRDGSILSGGSKNSMSDFLLDSNPRPSGYFGKRQSNRSGGSDTNMQLMMFANNQANSDAQMENGKYSFITNNAAGHSDGYNNESISSYGKVSN